MRKKIALFLICIMLVSSFIGVTLPVEAEKASGNTLYVGGSGPGNYTRIQDAINASSLGDIVFVYSGTYYENLLIDKTIYLIGEKRDITIIDGNKTDDVINVISHNVTINGFTIKNSGDDTDPDDITNIDTGVDIQSNDVTISNNIIANNYIGLSTRGPSSKKGLLIYDNIFMNNSKDEEKNTQVFQYYACYLAYTDYSKIYDNEFHDNDNGIWLSYSDYNQITGNQIINTTNNGPMIEAICFKDSDYNIVSDNYIKNTNLGIWIYSLSDLDKGNIIFNNTIRDTYCAINMQFCTENIVFENLLLINEYSIHLNYSLNNIFYHNNFIWNTENAYDDLSNHWCNTSIREGNFWDDYTGGDADQNGIGDIPHNITGGSNKDIYPLMKPWHNKAPEKPTITGETSGKPRIKYEYIFTSTDPELSSITYRINWGDDSDEIESGHYPSGVKVHDEHTYSKEGNYIIKAKAIDDYGAESEWATLEVSMPKINIYNILKQPLGRYIDRFVYAKINITLYGNYKISYVEALDFFSNVYIQSVESNVESPICIIHLEPFYLVPFERIYLDFFNCNIVYLLNPKTNLTKPVDTDGGYIAGDAIILITRGW